jgi:hypothetical protein
MKPVALPKEELERLAGTYTADDGSFTVEVKVEGTRLRGFFPGESPTLLVPVSPTRFRVPGALGMAAIFDLEAGRVVALSIEQGGQVALKLKPATREPSKP